VQPAGQHPSLFVHEVRGVFTHTVEHSLADPSKESTVHASPSSQDVGQFPSQVSFSSTIPFPHTFSQSLSDEESHPTEQQPSSSKQPTGRTSQRAVQSSALPTSAIMEHAGSGGHSVGHRSEPEPSGSQISPGSKRPFPHNSGETVTLLVAVPLFVLFVLFGSELLVSLLFGGGSGFF
jgi:hypothetical protein